MGTYSNKQRKKSKIPQWAQQRIDEAKEKRLIKLDLNGLGQNEKLTTIPDTIVHLTDLQWLDLSSNLLTTIPDAVIQLINLRSLDLCFNTLSAVPDAIAKLTNLQFLNLSGNGLQTVPNTLSQLTNLHNLYLILNQITIVPDAFSRLINLQVFDLSYNRLTTIPSWLVELPEMKSLYLCRNPIVKPPPEMLKLTDYTPVNLESLRSYFRQQREAGVSCLYEAKLIIVGEPGAGKTSLTRKLLNPTAPLPAKDESTEGIDVHKWEFPLPISANLPTTSLKSEISTPKPMFRVNIWDFGGQEIYHATHQFFLSRRSLYVVVADAREQKTDFYYWLNLIEHLSDRSPVFIFNNEIQNRHWAINEQQLQAYFPDSFRPPFAFNLANDRMRLEDLRQKIHHQISQLPHVGDELPATWVNVRNAIEENPRHTITQDNFIRLCEVNGFTRREDALQLSGYLHDLGVILHFQNDPLLKHTVVLRPEWGTEAAYAVLDNERVVNNFGRFSRADLHAIWQGAAYTNLHDELLALMMKFQLCYEIPGQKGLYIAPQLLGEQPPAYRWDSTNNLQLRYKYQIFMPKGLLSRFIVAMHPYIAKQRLVWRTGVVLLKEDTAAEVTELYPHREIRIRVAGKHKRDLLTIISYELEKLHVPFHRLKFQQLIPCNCSVCRAAAEPYFYRLDDLKTRLDHGKAEIECNKAPFETVQIRPLLDDVGLSTFSYDLPTLLQQLEATFNEQETRTLSFELGIDYDDLGGQGLKANLRELINYLNRRGRLEELVERVRRQRPHLPT